MKSPGGPWAASFLMRMDSTARAHVRSLPNADSRNTRRCELSPQDGPVGNSRAQRRRGPIRNLQQSNAAYFALHILHRHHHQSFVIVGLGARASSRRCKFHRPRPRLAGDLVRAEPSPASVCATNSTRFDNSPSPERVAGPKRWPRTFAR